ncbi:hypothetical protein IV203_034103 [Nitzschia inconspicua]|uniref:Uncharacterized protein n=1 Tax=Nitzschia inconspicua TaxID=303405 RepID=A0A9K3Q9J8_9STRA|nr:hypothetical protein IV203_034103 [Nitzschia inconspicua]
MHPQDPQSPTSYPKDETPRSNLDFDNLLEKQRELLKHIRSSPDKKKDVMTLNLPISSENGGDIQKTPPPSEWGWSFERVPNKLDVATETVVTAPSAEAGNSAGKKTKKQRRHERQQADEWISDWNFERITSSKNPRVTSASTFNEFDATSDDAPEWYFERIPPAAKPKSNVDDEDSVLEMALTDQQHDDVDDDFAALEDAVHDSDDISLEDLVVDGDDDDDNDDVIMGVEDDEGLLPQEPHYIQELKHRQYTATYMNELKHRQAEGYFVSQDLYNHIDSSPSSYTATMDEDGDASMAGPKDDRSIATPDTSDHTPKNKEKICGSGSSPTSIIDGPQVPSLSLGFPRPANLSASRSFGSRTSVQLPCAEGMDDLFNNTLQKLTQSMKRTAESRRSLKIKTEHTQEYERNLCVHQILQSVESSSRQVDTCLQMYRPLGTRHVASS